MSYSQFPWRRGIGNDSTLVFDNQSSVVAQRVGTSDGNLIAAAPDMLKYIKSSASAGCATAKQLLKNHSLDPHPPAELTET